MAAGEKRRVPGARRSIRCPQHPALTGENSRPSAQAALERATPKLMTRSMRPNPLM